MTEEQQEFSEMFKNDPLRFICRELTEIRKELKQMAATQADLDTAIANVKAAVDALNPATPPTPVDFQPEVDQLNAVVAEIKTKFPAPTPTPAL